MNLVKKENALGNVVKLLVFRNLAAELWSEPGRLGRLFGGLLVAIVISLILGIAVAFFERPRLPRNVAPGSPPIEVAPWHERFGLPERPRGLY